MGSSRDRISSARVDLGSSPDHDAAFCTEQEAAEAPQGAAQPEPPVTHAGVGGALAECPSSLLEQVFKQVFRGVEKQLGWGEGGERGGCKKLLGGEFG